MSGVTRKVVENFLEEASPADQNRRPGNNYATVYECCVLMICRRLSAVGRSQNIPIYPDGERTKRLARSR
jgi:hypothetical protein